MFFGTKTCVCVCVCGGGLCPRNFCFGGATYPLPLLRRLWGGTSKLTKKRPRWVIKMQLSQMFWGGRQVDAHAQWIGKQSFAHSRPQCLRVQSCAEELWGRDCRSQWFLSLRSVECGLEKPLFAGFTLPIFGLVKLRYPSCLVLCCQSERLKCFLRRNLFKVFLRGRFLKYLGSSSV